MPLEFGPSGAGRTAAALLLITSEVKKKLKQPEAVNVFDTFNVSCDQNLLLI